jgi:hypothetical protein
MKWTCTKCGGVAIAKEVGLLVQLGWWFTEPQGGLCPACARKVAYARVQEALEYARALRVEAK